MKQSLTHMLRGYLKIRMTGFMPERFMNLCLNHTIEIWDLHYEKETRSWIFYADQSDYRRVRPFVKKCGVHLELIRKAGLPFFLNRNRKRKLYMMGILSFVTILYLMTQFLWDITLEGNCHFSDDTLKSFLNDQQICYGMRKKKIDCDALEEQIRETFPEILWVSARVSGTRLLIHIKENTVYQRIPEYDESPCDLVSAVDGTITHMIIRQGKSQVTNGESVVKGQLLVSGRVPITDDSDAIVEEKEVKADADIIARTEKRILLPIPRRVQERIDTGQIRNGLAVETGNLRFVFMPPLTEQDEWRQVRERRQLSLFGNFYLPVWITRISAAQYQAYERTMTANEQKALLEKLMIELQEKFRQKGVVIIQNNVKILDRKMDQAAEFHFILEEPAAKAQKLTESKEIKQPDECN